VRPDRHYVSVIILQWTAGLLLQVPCAGTADVSGDGAINAIDATLILQYVAGLIVFS
jgi:hypothetical protein